MGEGLLNFAETYDVSLDWLVIGDGRSLNDPRSLTTHLPRSATTGWGFYLPLSRR
jgi:hypothetical protein